MILHMGATHKETPGAPPILTDDKGLVEWKSDIRSIMQFTDSAEITVKKSQISAVLRDWLAIEV